MQKIILEYTLTSAGPMRTSCHMYHHQQVVLTDSDACPLSALVSVRLGHSQAEISWSGAHEGCRDEGMPCIDRRWSDSLKIVNAALNMDRR